MICLALSDVHVSIKLERHNGWRRWEGGEVGVVWEMGQGSGRGDVQGQCPPCELQQTTYCTRAVARTSTPESCGCVGAGATGGTLPSCQRHRAIWPEISTAGLPAQSAAKNNHRGRRHSSRGPRMREGMGGGGRGGGVDAGCTHPGVARLALPKCHAWGSQPCMTKMTGPMELRER